MMKGKQDITIMVVDDDEVDVRGITRALRKNGIDNPIVVARNGAEALDMLEQGDTPAYPYLILLDINMPRMNGIEFLEAMRSNPAIADTVVFMLTTSDDERDMLAAYKQHVAGYLVKSDVGQGFVNLVSMLDQFTLTVRFPDRAA